MASFVEVSQDELRRVVEFLFGNNFCWLNHNGGDGVDPESTISPLQTSFILGRFRDWGTEAAIRRMGRRYDSELAIMFAINKALFPFALPVSAPRLELSNQEADVPDRVSIAITRHTPPLDTSTCFIKLKGDKKDLWYAKIKSCIDGKSFSAPALFGRGAGSGSV